jgi:SAM-dependent methyltransferase
MVWPSLPRSSAQLDVTDHHSEAFVAGLCSQCDHVQNSLLVERGQLPEIYSDSNYLAKRAVSAAMTGQLASVLSWITEHLGDVQGLRVLEIGSGGGEIAASLALRGATVYTVDPSVEGYDTPGITHCQSLFDHDYPHRDFDLVIARHVLEHTIYPAQFLRLIASRTRASGWLYLETPNGRIALDKFRPLDYFIDHVQHFSPNSLSRLVRETGWSIQQSRTLLSDNHLAVLAQPGEQAHLNWGVGPTDLMNQLGRSVNSFQRKLARISSADSLIIYGAGAHAVTLAAVMNEETRNKVVAVWDRDPAKQGRHLPGIKAAISQPGQGSASLIVNTGVLYPQEIADYIKNELSVSTEVLQLVHQPGLVTGPASVE